MIACRFVFSAFGRQSAQAVVRPERDDEHVDLLLQQPIDSAQTARARVAAQARVLDFERQICRANFLARSTPEKPLFCQRRSLRSGCRREKRCVFADAARPR